MYAIRSYYESSEYSLCSGVQAVETPGHTAGHMSLLIELPKGKPILLAGDAADLQENLEKEIVPGLCWQDREDMALDSIKKLKHLAKETGAELWPNHDITFVITSYSIHYTKLYEVILLLMSIVNHLVSS